MPVTFQDGRLYGDEGCYADRGRLMAAIYYDIKCNKGYFALTDGRIYVQNGTDLFSFMGAWANNKQPGCLWNFGGYNKPGSGLREISPEAFRLRYVDVEMLPPDYDAKETNARPPENWGEDDCVND